MTITEKKAFLNNVMPSSLVDPIKFPVSGEYKDAVPDDRTGVGNLHPFAHAQTNKVHWG